MAHPRPCACRSSGAPSEEEKAHPCPHARWPRGVPFPIITLTDRHQKGCHWMRGWGEVDARAHPPWSSRMSRRSLTLCPGGAHPCGGGSASRGRVLKYLFFLPRCDVAHEPSRYKPKRYTVRQRKRPSVASMTSAWEYNPLHLLIWRRRSRVSAAVSVELYLDGPERVILDLDVEVRDEVVGGRGPVCDKTPARLLPSGPPLPSCRSAVAAGLQPCRAPPAAECQDLRRMEEIRSIGARRGWSMVAEWKADRGRGRQATPMVQVLSGRRTRVAAGVGRKRVAAQGRRGWGSSASWCW